MTTIQKVFLALFVLFLVAIPLWLFLAVPKLETISPDFHQRTDVTSFDNFFDPEKNAFKGVQYTRAQLDIKVTSVEGDHFIIDQTFDVKTLEGKPIYKTERQYGVNPKTRENVPGVAESKQEGYFFFPKHAEKVSYPFLVYIRDDVIDMKFVEEENLLGLVTYHYEGFADKDASHYFSFFDKEAKEGKGVHNKADIDVWVEPTSGQIVNIKHVGENTYFDPKTGQRLFPRNIYSNIFTNDAITNRVRIAHNKKQTFILYERWIPILLGTIGIAMLLSLAASRRLFSQSKE